MLKGSSVYVTEDLSRWTLHLFREFDFLCFQSVYLNRAKQTICCRRIRQCRAELRKFMRNVKKGNPAATVIIWEFHHQPCGYGGLFLPSNFFWYYFMTISSATVVSHCGHCNYSAAGASSVWQAVCGRQVFCLERSQGQGDKLWLWSHSGGNHKMMIRMMTIICMMMQWKGDRAVCVGCWPWQWATWLSPW